MGTDPRRCFLLMDATTDNQLGFFVLWLVRLAMHHANASSPSSLLPLPPPPAGENPSCIKLHGLSIYKYLQVLLPLPHPFDVEAFLSSLLVSSTDAMLVTPIGLQQGRSDPAPTRKPTWSLTDDDMFLLRSTSLTYFTAVLDEIRQSLRRLGVATLPRARDLCTHEIIGGSKLLSSSSCSFVKLLGTRPSRDMTFSLLLHYYAGVANVIRDMLSRVVKCLVEMVDPILEMALTIPRVSRALTRGWLGLGEKNQDHQIWLIVRLLTTFSLLILYVLPDIFQAWFKKRFKSVSVSMPWSIPPALVVLWGVAWMFYGQSPIEDFQLDAFDFFHSNYYDDFSGVNFNDAGLSFPETILAPTASRVAFLAVPDVHHTTQDPLPQLVAVQNNVVPPIETHGDGQGSPDNPPGQAP